MVTLLSFADRLAGVRSHSDAGRQQRLPAPVVLLRGLQHGGERAVHVQHHQLREGELAVQLWHEADTIQRSRGQVRSAWLGADRRRHLLLSELLPAADQRQDVPDHVLYGRVSARV